MKFVDFVSNFQRTYGTSNDENLQSLYPYREFRLTLVIDKDNRVDNKTEDPKTNEFIGFWLFSTDFVRLSFYLDKTQIKRKNKKLRPECVVRGGFGPSQ